jgi:hypothetical protein
MKLTEKKIHTLIDHITVTIKDYQDLIDMGRYEYIHNRYTLTELLDYITDLFDVNGKHEPLNTVLSHIQGDIDTFFTAIDKVVRK